MLFFIQYLALPPAHWMQVRLRANAAKQQKNPAQARTNGSHVWRWNQPRMLAPRCKQLPLEVKGTLVRRRESMLAK